MTSRSNSWKSELSAEVSASQPISCPGPCSDPRPCPDCGLPSGPTCPACEDAFCAAHLYRCANCDSPFCAACLADHHTEPHWSDSDTAAELTRGHTPRFSPPPAKQADGEHNHGAYFEPMAFALARPGPYSEPIAFALARRSSHCLPETPLPATSLTTSISTLLQRLRSHLQTQSEERSESMAALHGCVYIQIFCARCGYMRQALAALPPQATASCPGCARHRPFAVLAVGFTWRALPFHERLFLAGHAPYHHPWERLPSRDRQSRRRKQPAHSLDAETRDYLLRNLARFRDIAGSLLRPPA